MPRLSAGQRRRVAFRLNGRAVAGDAEPRLLLSDFLRHTVGLTGTHVGCEHGVCGACTVQVDGRAMRSCLMLAIQAEDRDIRTVEALGGPEGALSPLQEAFRRHHALQCGFCTPGILMTLDDYLRRRPAPTEAEIRDLLSGHLCRCTGYTGIVNAALEASAKLASQRETGAPPPLAGEVGWGEESDGRASHGLPPSRPSPAGGGRGTSSGA
jgi:2-furoyl-CoA dehydrogenase 2Fe-2S iron sulfur subunit